MRSLLESPSQRRTDPSLELEALLATRQGSLRLTAVSPDGAIRTLKADYTFMIDALLDFYRFSADPLLFELSGELSKDPTFFRFGRGLTCYGRHSKMWLTGTAEARVTDGRTSNQITKNTLYFNPDEVISNLRKEKYVSNSQKSSGLRKLGKSLYYISRPVLPFQWRSFIKRLSMTGWTRKTFPAWPVDRTVEGIFKELLLLTMKALNLGRLPFIWFWPDGYSGCSLMTHDVETIEGLRFCSSLMDLNDTFGIKSSFQLIPEDRYPEANDLMQEMRDRGYEINVHDWNHDGKLFSSQATFLERATKINYFASRWQAKGFRSGALYRNVEWYDAFRFSYDMSVPNVAHLDPQQGGCCTVMPYFVGDILEIPVTAVQDYMLFHLLQQYSISTWRNQASLIMEENGLISFIVHPDYIIQGRARKTYSELLAFLAKLRDEGNLWIPLPRDVNSWWRSRNQMRLVPNGSEWSIEGPESHRACVAYAVREGEEVVYDFPTRRRTHGLTNTHAIGCAN